MAGLNYQSSGVDYDRLDAFKRACQREAATTIDALLQHGMSEVEGTRGESAYLIETPDAFLAHVEEGLGTKNLVADAMQKLTGRTYYDAIGIDTVATIVNDLITTGALPICVAMHAAVGSTMWFDDATRAESLARGFARACTMSGATWGGGETPALRGIVNDDSIVLAGSAIGIIRPKSLRITGNIEDGDAIVLLASSGVQTNGLTLCRALADRLPDGYGTKIDESQSYGEALLAPSKIYVDFIAACQREGIPLHYAVHITGHGWRKLMRLESPFVYRINDVGPRHALFDFIQDRGQVERREMYATFNMGAGFAVYIQNEHAKACMRIARDLNHTAWIAGTVEKQGDRRAVEIAPLGITFESETLAVRDKSNSVTPAKNAVKSGTRGVASNRSATSHPASKVPSRKVFAMPRDFFRIDSSTDNGGAKVLELFLPEVFDSAEFDQLSESILSTVQSESGQSQSGSRWVIDLANVSYMGSAMLGLMVNLRQQIRGAGGQLVLCCMPPTLLQIFKTCCMERLFIISKSRADAVKR